MRPSSSQRTFGYHRVGIMTALVNSLSFVLIAIWIFWEAIIRLRAPEPVQSAPMIVVALIAIGVNAIISLWLKGDAKHDLNVRSAYVHMVGDAISAAGVVFAGIVVATTGSYIADTLVSVFIGVLILWSSWSVLAEANFPSTLRWSPGGDALYYQDTDEVEESVFRVPMATKESERVTRFGDLLSSGAARCIFTGLSPDGSVYVTVDHGDVDVYAIDLELP